MSQRSSDVPEQVRKFAPKDRPREHPTEEAGRALIAMLQQANELTNEARDRAAGYASKLGTELRAVEDHITRHLLSPRTRKNCRRMAATNPARDRG
jgi:hypothetical protein